MDNGHLLSLLDYVRRDETRLVYCIATNFQSDYEYEYETITNNTDCERNSLNVKPATSRECGTECAEYRWRTSSYDKCNSTCGSGVQSRSVECGKIVLGWPNSTATTDYACITAKQGPKPTADRNCTSPCNYTTSEWSACSETCGGGTRTRTLSCIKINENRTQKIVPISNCDTALPIGDRPSTVQPCIQSSCRKTFD